MDLVAGDDFWPGLSIAEFASSMRIPDTVDTIRNRDALRGGMLAVRREMRSWKLSHTEAGIAKLSDIGAETIDGVHAGELLYTRAVFHTAAAELAETHADISATAEGRERNEGRESVAQDLRRIATHAIRDLKGITRTAVELI